MNITETMSREERRAAIALTTARRVRWFLLNAIRRDAQGAALDAVALGFEAETRKDISASQRRQLSAIYDAWERGWCALEEAQAAEAAAAEEPAKQEFTVYNAKENNGLHYTVNHSGKMAGMQSLSTSTLNNERCRKNAQIPGSVCQKCYAATQLKRFTSMQTPLDRNMGILSSRVLGLDEIPHIFIPYFRFEAFGDLVNSTHAINYFQHCYKNPNVKFALWTKNPDFIAEAISQGWEKPSNLVIVLSSLFINQVRDAAAFPFVDKVFTVYSKDYIEEHATPINCGARNCFNCHLCYEHNGVRHISEKLK